MALSISITANKAIKLVFLDTDSQIEVAAFEGRIKTISSLTKFNLLLSVAVHISNRLLDDSEVQTVPLSVSPVVGVLLVDLH